jgi:CRISPR type III-B/RAMP module RAMP protein Cmr6
MNDRGRHQPERPRGGGGAAGRQDRGRPALQQAGNRALRGEISRLLLPGVVTGLSPGFYFQRCLAMWDGTLREILKDKKAEALKPLEGRPDATEGPVRGDLELHRAILARQEAGFLSIRAAADGFELPLRSLAPFVTGIGQPHPLETGFAFLKPYGVPYLAGSGVKGAVRAACRVLWREEFGGPDAPEVRERLEHYFGSADGESRRGAPAEHRRGALVFLDLFPEPPQGNGWAGAFRLDLVNPHYGPYYQSKDVPGDCTIPCRAIS